MISDYLYYFSYSSVIHYMFIFNQDYGDLEFKSGQLVRDLIKEFGIPNHAVPIPGGESHEAVMLRNAAFFDVSLFLQ